MSRYLSRTLLTAVLIATSFYTFSQKKVFQHSVNWTSGGKVNVYYFPSDTKDQFALVLANWDSVKTLLVTNSFKIRARFTAPRNKDFENFSGGIVKRDSIVIFFHNDLKMHAWTYSTKSGKISESTIDFNPRREKDLLALSTGNRHFFISFSKSNSSIITYTFDNNPGYKRNEYHLPDDISIGRKDVAGINHIDVPDAEFMIKQNKFYSMGDSLFLVSNKSKNETKILAMDLNTGLSFKRTITSKTSSEPATFNSFLHEDKLYIVCANKEKLLVTVNDFYSGGELSRFEAKSEDEIKFANTPVSISGNRLSSMNTYREVDKAKVFLNRLNEGGALIGVAKNDSSLNEVTVGAIKNFTEIVGSFSPFAAGPRSVGNYTRQWKRIANFKMLLDPQTNRQVPGDISFDIFEKMDHYKNGIGTVDEEEAIIKIAGLPHFVYYDRNAKKLCIVKI